MAAVGEGVTEPADAQHERAIWGTPSFRPAAPCNRRERRHCARSDGAPRKLRAWWEIESFETSHAHADLLGQQVSRESRSGARGSLNEDRHEARVILEHGRTCAEGRRTRSNPSMRAGCL